MPVNTRNAAKETEVQWNEIQDKTAHLNIVWRHAPSGGQHRDGAAEAAVKMLKSTVKHMTKGGQPTYEEMQILLSRASDVVNMRPLGVKHHNGAEPSLSPITPNSLLKMSRTNVADFTEPINWASNDTSLKRARFMDQCLNDWWSEWFLSVADSLVPLKKWKNVKANVKLGDVVLLKTEHKYGPGTYKLAIVLQVQPDEKGLVRTVVVGSRPKDSRDTTLPFVSKKLFQQTVPVQRVVIIVPADQIPDQDSVPDSAGDKVPHAGSGQPSLNTTAQNSGHNDTSASVSAQVDTSNADTSDNVDLTSYDQLFVLSCDLNGNSDVMSL